MGLFGRLTGRAAASGANGPAERREPRLTALPLPRQHGPRPSAEFARSYLGGMPDRLLADLPTAVRSGNAELRPTLRTMRVYSRHLAQNNDYVRNFLRILRRNVAGPTGATLQMRVKDRDGKPDADANARIEESFERWSRVGICTVDGRLSRADLERLHINQTARDGEVLVRLVRGYPNAYRFAVQLIEADHLDEELNVAFGAAYAGVPKARDTEIRMGVERDRWGRAVAYHILVAHPGDDVYTISGRRYIRVPAAEILHNFLPERIGDARGVPWIYSAIRRMTQLGGYEEAELVAARVAASKMGFYTEALGDEADSQGDEETGDGALLQDAEPGTFDRLPRGLDFKLFDPQHPTNAFPFFVKAMLRGGASGMGVNYNTLANDAEGVNYSSLRHFALEDRDEWRTLQNWQRDHLGVPVFEAWLDMALMAGVDRLDTLPIAKFEKFNAPEFQGRGWSWVDPEKEINAEEKAVNLGVRSRSQICAERGTDFEDVLRQLKREQELAAEIGVTLAAPGASPAPSPAKPHPKPDEGEPDA